MTTEQTVSQRLIDRFADCRSRGVPVALVTTVHTEGSTYSKPGNQTLIESDQSPLGLVSGGCLETDLEERAAECIATGTSRTVSYDLREDDDLFGLGVGCEGLIVVVIQPLTPQNDYEPFASQVVTLQRNRRASVSIASETVGTVSFTAMAPPRLLVLGAGPDSVPLLKFAATLGWRVSVADHRPDAVENVNALDGIQAVQIDAGARIPERLLERVDAAIVMSHNLDRDRSYLREVADTDVPFIGLLGPPHRRERLLTELGKDGEKLAGRLQGPVGKRIGGRGAEAIALEIVAELQSRFCS